MKTIATGSQLECSYKRHRHEEVSVYRTTFLFALLTVVGISDLQAGQLGTTLRQFTREVPDLTNLLVGDWTATPTKPGRLPRRDSTLLRFAFDDDTVTLTRRAFLAGRFTGSMVTYQTDGQEHPWGPADYAVTRVGARVLNVVYTLDGRVLGQRTFVASVDRLTVTTLVKDADGNDDVSQFVLDRQWPVEG